MPRRAWAIALLALIAAAAAVAPAAALAGTGRAVGHAAIRSLSALPRQSATRFATSNRQSTLHPGRAVPAPSAAFLLPRTLIGTPSPLASFIGMQFDTLPSTYGFPPDTVGAAGPTAYVQGINGGLGVYSKTTGALLAGYPKDFASLWSGVGGPCADDYGDIIVNFDRQAGGGGRFVASQFALPTGGPYLMCIAVSDTADPTGGWHAWSFQLSEWRFPDYPKLSVWPDGYYVTVNDYAGDQGGFVSGSLYVFDRSAMLAGAPSPAFVSRAVGRRFDSLLAADEDGSTPPPAGAAEYVVGVGDTEEGWAHDHLEVFRAKPTWGGSPSLALTGPRFLRVRPFGGTLCASPYGLCVPQPGTGQRLDGLQETPMYRLDYRNFGATQAMVLNHTVRTAAGNSGVRWYQLKTVGGGAPSVAQTGTFAPADGVWRWMGSIAMDRRGDIALGYSASGRSTSPGIRYATRLANDKAGTLLEGERVLWAGRGSQTGGGSSGRWGDYSAMTVDPTDDCTFWYTNEYQAYDHWATRIGRFVFPRCTASDGVAPAAPLLAAIQPQVGVATTARRVRVALTASTDPSGIAGYAVRWSRLPNAWPPGVVTAAAGTTTLASPRLTAGRWWVSVRAGDNAGNWSVVRRLGPFVLAPLQGSPAPAGLTSPAR